VNVVCDYARIDGVRVTVGIHSRADVRLVGDSAFAMNYDYTMINGRRVRPARELAVNADRLQLVKQLRVIP
jgi:hypothetical protein